MYTVMPNRWILWRNAFEQIYKYYNLSITCSDVFNSIIKTSVIRYGFQTFFFFHFFC
jgi:hypothetical protein